MEAFRICNYIAGRWRWVTLAVLLWLPLQASAAMEQTFDVLQIGTRTYKNVTVTTKAKDYVFILHSAGMASFKIRDLSPEVLKQLGYGARPTTVEKPGGTWMKRANSQLAKLQIPQLQQVEQDLRGLEARRSAVLAWLTPQRRFMLLGAAVLLYLFFCYCSGLICQKAGEPAGALIWFPLVQMLPLLRAAKMSGWWLLAFLVPVVNLIVQVVWSFKIVQARAKSFWLGLLLLLPGTNLLTFLYLAFSDAAPQKEAPVVEIMTLDAA